MLKALKNLGNHKPKGGYRGWEYPKELPGGDKYVFNDDYQTIEDLVHHVRSFEKINGFEHILGLRDILEDYFCRSCSFFRQFCVDDSELTTMDKIRRVIEGGKAVLKIKAKSATRSLKVLDLEEVQENVNKCLKCSLNKFHKEVQHERMYVHDIEKAYGVKDIKEVEVDKHEKLGQCTGCGCKVMSKVFLHVDSYAHALLKNIHDINRMLNANINGEVCWQLENIFHKEHLEIMKKHRRVTKSQLIQWGYIDG